MKYGLEGETMEEMVEKAKDIAYKFTWKMTIA
jgi:hypothetical protein